MANKKKPGVAAPPAGKNIPIRREFGMSRYGPAGTGNVRSEPEGAFGYALMGGEGRSVLIVGQ